MATASKDEFILTTPFFRERQSGSAVTLSCHLLPETSAVAMEIRWFKGTDCVFLYKNGQTIEGRDYEGRVSLFTQELERGNVSLQLRDSRWSDRGHYLCQVTHGDRTQECTVEVDCVCKASKKSHLADSGYVHLADSGYVHLADSGSGSGHLADVKFPSTILSGSIPKIQRAGSKRLSAGHSESGSLWAGRSQSVHSESGHSESGSLWAWRSQSHSESGSECLQFLEPMNQEDRESLPIQAAHIYQSYREWTDEERMKMKESALLTEFKQLKRIQEERNLLVKNQRVAMNRDKRATTAVKEDIQLFRNLHLYTTQSLMTKQQRKFDRRMEDKHRELGKLKLNLFMEKDQEKQLEERNKTLEEKNKQLKLKDIAIEGHLKTIENQNKIIKELVKEKERLLENSVNELETSKKQLKILGKELQDKESLLKENSKTFQLHDATLKEKDTLRKLLNESERLLENTLREEETSKKQLEILGKELQDKSSQLQEMKILLEQQKAELAENDKQLEEKDKQVEDKDGQLEEKDRLLEERSKQLQGRTDPDSSVPVRRRHSRGLNPPEMGGEPSSPDSSVPVPVPELRLVLLGRTGSGKSAAANTFLGREERSQAGTSTVTQQSESRQGEVAGRKVTVVDTPDWFCPELSLEEVRQDVGLCVRLSAPGPHVFLLVTPLKQPAGEMKRTLEKMEEIFGERCWRNTMILFIVTEEEKNPEQVIQTGSQEVQTLLQKCGNRFHCINIKASGDGSQISELLEKIEKMVDGNRERFYSSEIYLETESQIREMEQRIVREIERMKGRKEQEAREKRDKSLEEVLIKYLLCTDDLHAEMNKHEERITELEKMLKAEKEDSVKKELQRQLDREINQRKEIQLELHRLREGSEKEKREMEERHRQEMEEIMKMYEGEAWMEAEKNLMKTVLPELHRTVWDLMSVVEKQFLVKLERKDQELLPLNQKLSEITEIYRQDYHSTLRRTEDIESGQGEKEREGREAFGEGKEVEQRQDEMETIIIDGEQMDYEERGQEEREECEAEEIQQEGQEQARGFMGQICQVFCCCPRPQVESEECVPMRGAEL